MTATQKWDPGNIIGFRAEMTSMPPDEIALTHELSVKSELSYCSTLGKGHFKAMIIRAYLRVLS